MNFSADVPMLTRSADVFGKVIGPMTLIVIMFSSTFAQVPPKTPNNNTVLNGVIDRYIRQQEEANNRNEGIIRYPVEAISSNASTNIEVAKLRIGMTFTEFTEAFKTPGRSALPCAAINVEKLDSRDRNYPTMYVLGDDVVSCSNLGQFQGKTIESLQLGFYDNKIIFVAMSPFNDSTRTTSEQMPSLIKAIAASISANPTINFASVSGVTASTSGIPFHSAFVDPAKNELHIFGKKEPFLNGSADFTGMQVYFYNSTFYDFQKRREQRRLEPEERDNRNKAVPAYLSKEQWLKTPVGIIPDAITKKDVEAITYQAFSTIAQDLGNSAVKEQYATCRSNATQYFAGLASEATKSAARTQITQQEKTSLTQRAATLQNDKQFLGAAECIYRALRSGLHSLNRTEYAVENLYLVSREYADARLSAAFFTKLKDDLDLSVADYREVAKRDAEPLHRYDSLVAALADFIKAGDVKP